MRDADGNIVERLTQFISSIPGKTIKPWVAGLLLVMGCLIVYCFFTRKEWGVAGKQLSRPRMTILGLVAGFLDAVGGGGWGPVATPSLISFFDFSLATKGRPRTSSWTKYHGQSQSRKMTLCPAPFGHFLIYFEKALNFKVPALDKMSERWYNLYV